MKLSFGTAAFLLALGLCCGSPDASAGTGLAFGGPGSLAVPSMTITSVLGSPPQNSVIRVAVSGNPGDGFTVIYVFRLPDGSLFIDPQTGAPFLGIYSGLVVPLSGTWVQEFSIVAFGELGPDFTVEAAAVPNVILPDTMLLSWTFSVNHLTLQPGDPTPAPFTSSTVNVGCYGPFLDTEVAIPDPTDPSGLTYFLVPSGPAGLFPIG